MAVALRVVGLADLQETLTRLEKKTSSKIVRQAIRAGAKTILDETKLHTPVDTGLMLRRMTVRAMKRKRGRTGYRLMFKNVNRLSGKTKAGGRTFYPAAVEYGTKHQAAQPFMREGFAAAAPRAEEQIARMIGSGILAAAKH